MTQSTISVGAFANDPNADSIRVGFQKCNANFTELFSGPVTYSVSLSGTHVGVYAAMQVNVAHDSAQDVADGNGKQGVVAFDAVHTVDSTLATGNRAGAFSRLYVTAISTVLSPQLMGFFSEVQTNINLGGTGLTQPTASGEAAGTYNRAIIQAAATNLWQTSAAFFEHQLDGTAANRFGVACTSFGANQGALRDAAFWATLGTGAGWKYGLMIEPGATTQAPIRIPWDTIIKARNDTDTADTNLIRTNNAVTEVQVGSFDYNIRIIGTASVNIQGNATPVPDNTYSCGQNGFRWSAVWAANGTIQTSDISLKTDIASVPAGALAIVQDISPITFRWKIGGLEKDGTSRPGKRTHWGFDANQINERIAKTGYDFGGYVKGEDGTHNLRPDQLIPILWKAIQELQVEVEVLKEKLK